MIPQSEVPVYDAGPAPDASWRLRGGDAPPQTSGPDEDSGQTGCPLTVSDRQITGVEAVRQAVKLILNTERCRYPIFSWNYGIELEDLFGRPASFVRPELERRVREALLQDDRVTGVDGFLFEHGRKGLGCVFTVRTIFGILEGMGIDRIRIDP
jgi:hypothetical protein